MCGRYSLSQGAGISGEGGPVDTSITLHSRLHQEASVHFLIRGGIIDDRVDRNEGTSIFNNKHSPPIVSIYKTKSCL